MVMKERGRQKVAEVGKLNSNQQLQAGVAQRMSQLAAGFTSKAGI
jgi:hypothetical protein